MKTKSQNKMADDGCSPAKRLRSFGGLLKSPAQRTPLKKRELSFITSGLQQEEKGAITTSGASQAGSLEFSQQHNSLVTSLGETVDDVAHRKWTLEDFDMGKPLGRGKFGNVYLAKEKESGVIVAMKVISKSTTTDENLHHLKREVEIQSRIKHKNIMQLFGYFHNSSSAFLILEYASSGELFRLIQQSPRGLDEQTAAMYVSQVASAVAYMHERSIIHRDIKPENVLLLGGSVVKLADFGGSIHAPPPHHYRSTMCGTPEYVAPEVLNDRQLYDNSIDMWALGILCFELIIGYTPFVVSEVDPTKKTEAIYLEIQAFRSPLLFPSAVSKTASHFIRSLVDQNPKRRAKASELLEHDWLKDLSNTDETA